MERTRSLFIVPLAILAAVLILVYAMSSGVEGSGVTGHVFQFATPVTPEVPDIPRWIARLVALIIQIIRDILANL